MISRTEFDKCIAAIDSACAAMEVMSAYMSDRGDECIAKVTMEHSESLANVANVLEAKVPSMIDEINRKKVRNED